MEQTGKRFRKRDAILTCLRRSHVHPSADWVYAQLKPQFPDLSLATVYRNLTLFKEQGLIRSIGTVDGVEHFDGNTAPHAHFVCSHCARVMDIMGLESLPALQMQAEDQVGGRITGASLTFFGLCPDCHREGGETE